MEDRTASNPPPTKSISCVKLPEALLDKVAAKQFFGKFGVIKSLVLRPKRNQCIVEFETIEAAQQALRYQGNFLIFPTPVKQDTAEHEFIDPDVQSELDLMYPAGIRPQPSKQGMESFIRNPQALMKPRTSPRFKTTEPLSVAVNSDPRLVSIARNELEALARRPARTAEEKLQVLDARDKLYRLINARSTDISKVTSTKGTCKDMCPEKERIMREARLQVASFELSDYDSSMDQKKAIKQYSRSAADAEAPLPHELRPETSLKTTMTYLLHNIINLCENTQSIGDWFHFVWDRTRGIRKDITQQELCSPITVELVEQCVRFHIHCSARLIAEDPSIFDQKINTENLTKCLQTLKYMYNDLKVKSIKCQNEAEFRAYVVLLNLNESGNFLWEIKQLEKSALNSKEVRFALDVYFAVANNNYVKFFNLAREASYMNACLMLRYFTQVRMKAINIIMRSYTPKRLGFDYKISVLTDILGFDDSYSAVSFLSHHNLQCDIERDIVCLDRQKFGLADTPFQMRCPREIVDSKLESTVAEAICGGPLPSPECFQTIIPHSSFDNDGFLKRESFYAEDQNGPSEISKENVFKIPKESPPVSPKSRVYRNDQPDGTANENVFYKSPATSAFSSVKTAPPNVFKISSRQPEAKPANPFASKPVFGLPQNQADSIFGAATSASSFSKQSIARTNPATEPTSPFSFVKSVEKPIDSIFGSSTFGSQPKDVFGMEKPIEITLPAPSFNQFSFSATAQQVADAERKRKEQEESERKKREEELRLKEKAVQAEKLRLEIELKEKIERERSEAAKIRKEEEEKRRLEEIAEKERATQEACDQLLVSLLDEIVDETVKSEAQQSVSLFVKMPEEFYDALEFDVVVEQAHKIYQLEFLAHVNETKMKYQLLSECFSQWRKTTRKEIERREKLANIGCSILNSSLDQQAHSLHHPEQRASLSNMKQYLSGSPQAIKITDINKFPTINLFDALLVKPFDLSVNIFWKLLVSIPYRNEENCLGFSTFINKWLIKTFGESTDENIFYIRERMMRNSRRKLAICIRKLQGSELIDESAKKSTDAVDQSHGLIFFATSTNLQAARRRLQNILDKLELPVPVSVIIYKNNLRADDEAEVGRHFDLSRELGVSSFEINLYYECHEKNKTLTQVVVDSCQLLNDLHIDHLLGKNVELFDLEMQHLLDFFQLTVGDEMWKRVEFSCRQSEKFMKSMRSFNNVVNLFNKSIDKLMSMISNDFKKLPMLPAEFRKLLLPFDLRIPNGYEYFPEDWKSMKLQKKQIAFAHGLKLVTMPNDNFSSFDDFKRKLMNFLTMNNIEHKENLFHTIVTKLIEYLYRHNLTSDDDVLEEIQNFCWLNILGEIVVGKFNEMFQQNQLPTSIIYHKRDLHLYRTVPWWYSIKFDDSDHAVEPVKKKAKFEQATSAEIEKLLLKSVVSLSKLKGRIDNFKEVSTTTREVSKDFDRHLYNFEENFRSRMQEWEEKFKE